MDYNKPYIISYNKVIRYSKKYNMNIYNTNGKQKTYNKLKHCANDHQHKSQKFSQTQKLYNSIKQYMYDDINDAQLHEALCYYIGN